MNKTDKYNIEKKRKETSLKTMYFNRFLLIRYITAALFFSNLYWFSALLISRKITVFIPGILLICMTVTALEQFTFFSQPSDEAKKTRFSYKVTLSINVIILALVASPLFSELFPFLLDNMKSKGIILGIISLGVVLCLITLKRLEKIENHTDKQYKYAKQLERTLRVKV